MTTRTKRQYDVDFHYTRRGMGVGICTYRYQPFAYFSAPLSAGSESTMAFREMDGILLFAEGEPSIGLDSGYHDDDWHSVKELLYEESPDDGTIEEMLDDEYPGLLTVVRGCLRDHRSHKLALVSGRPIKIPARGKTASDVARISQLVRAFLGFRGKDDVGHSVIVHGRSYVHEGIIEYQGTVVYESRSWAYEFDEWYAGWLEEPLQQLGEEEPMIDVLSSYEIAVCRNGY